VSRRRIVLSGVGPKLEGLSWEADDVLRIGRQDTLDVVLQDPSVSRRHAEILPAGDGWFLSDLASSNGTYLNGEQVVKSERPLRPDDLIQVGELSLRVVMADVEKGAAPVPEEPPPTDRLCTVLPADPGGPGQVTATVSRLRTSGAFVKIQARAQRTWDEALTAMAPGEENSRQGKQLLALLRTGQHLSGIASLDELLRSILEDAVRTFAAQRASIVLADPATGRLELRAMVTASGVATKRAYSHTLAERSF
jgi:pSer/pThr/pTyr-binding forkhead associated (FHA) protein